jgi:hypothetical protein
MNVKLIVFIAFASFPLTFSFLLCASQLNVVNSYALIGIIASTLLLYAQRNAKAAIITVCGPFVPALYLLVLYGDPNLVLSLGSGYLLISPLVIFLSSLAENPRGILTSYLFSCCLALVILNVVLAGIATADSLLVQFGAFLVATFLGKILPFYPAGGFGLAGELLGMPIAVGAVGLAFLLASSPKGFNIRLSGYVRMVKAMLLSAVFISLISVLSLVSSSMTNVIIAVSVLALSVAVFQVSRRS